MNCSLTKFEFRSSRDLKVLPVLTCIHLNLIDKTFRSGEDLSKMDLSLLSSAGPITMGVLGGLDQNKGFDKKDVQTLFVPQK